MQELAVQEAQPRTAQGPMEQLLKLRDRLLMNVGGLPRTPSLPPCGALPGPASHCACLPRRPPLASGSYVLRPTRFAAARAGRSTRRSEAPARAPRAAPTRLPGPSPLRPQAATLREPRGTTHCLKCKGTGTCECKACRVRRCALCAVRCAGARCCPGGGKGGPRLLPGRTKLRHRNVQEPPAWRALSGEAPRVQL